MDIQYRKIKKNVLKHFRYEKYLLDIVNFIKFNPYDRICVIYKDVNYLKAVVCENLSSDKSFEEYDIGKEKNIEFEDKYDVFVLFLMTHVLDDKRLEKLLKDIKEALTNNGSVFVVDYAQPKGLRGSFFKFVLNITDKDAYERLNKENKIFNKCGFAEGRRATFKRGYIKIIHLKQA
ncbi:MAG: hypothetical protein J7J73_00310 [Deltaproteobacteria bacterium]|nr:hypothetical protein [Deltaproteobacteria bacterium]